MRKSEVVNFDLQMKMSNKTILQLDDASLLRILELLDPLPDRFHAAQVCKVCRYLYARGL